MNHLEDALEDFKKALTLDNKNPIIFSNMGLVLRKMEDFETAAYCYSQELIFSSENTRTLNNRGYCLAKMGNKK